MNESELSMAARCERLGVLLQQQQMLWRSRAFVLPQLPWESSEPQLAAALRAMPLAESELLAADPEALTHWLQPWLPQAAELADLCRMPRHPRRRDSRAFAEPRDVPGRKWRQIQAFVETLPQRHLPALEWCAGKGHLGRHYAAWDGAPVHGLERDPLLVAAGNALSRRAQLPVDLLGVDVLSAAGRAAIDPSHQVLALHACGDLHLALLHDCVERRPRALALAPCCYQLTRLAHAAPLSAAGQRHDLRLSIDDLHTAVQDSVTSPLRVRRQRQRLQAWRLGFDTLQREVREVDQYLQAPPLPLSILRLGFEHACRQLAKHKQLPLPAAIDFDRYERIGAARAETVAALDLVRLLFRRPLEIWLVLDRALYLEEHGYEVSVGTFCERSITPRNLLIQARRR